MRIEFTDDAGVFVAGIEGDIDFGSAGDLGRDVMRALPDAAAGLVVDLTGVRYIDSGGVRALFELAADLDASRRNVALAVPETSPIRRLIEITRLGEVFLLCPNAQDCAEMIRQMSADEPGSRTANGS